jgi:hypothetical protein
VTASGEDNIVVVVRKGQLQKSFDSDIRAKFPPGLKDVDSLEKFGKNVEENFDNVDVTFKTYDEVK